MYIFNALAITDTTSHASAYFDFTPYRKVKFIAYSSLNQSVTINPQYLYYGYNSYQAGSYTGDNIIIPGDNIRRNINSQYPDLDEGLLCNQIRFIAVCSVAPTSGSLTLLALGVPN